MFRALPVKLERAKYKKDMNYFTSSLAIMKDRYENVVIYRIKVSRPGLTFRAFKLVSKRQNSGCFEGLSIYPVCHEDKRIRKKQIPTQPNRTFSA